METQQKLECNLSLKGSMTENKFNNVYPFGFVMSQDKMKGCHYLEETSGISFQIK